MQGAVILTERPRVLGRDTEGRLHCEDGPAIAYPDGWGFWAVHGVRVPQQVVEAPNTLTADQIVGESNAEVRRVMIERFGADRLMADAGGRVVDSDVDELGAPRDLLTLALDGDEDEPLTMVRVRNSTPEPDGSWRTYMLRVPPSMRTVREALAWTFDVPPSEYELAVQS